MMQQARFMNSSKSSKVAKPFCGVCYKAGKSENEYTNHYTKSVPGEGGVVICPTILCNECTYCHEIGHFKNACPLLIAKEKNCAKVSKYTKKNVSVPKPAHLSIPRVNTSNSFSALEDCEDDDVEVGVIRHHVSSHVSKSFEEFPSLSNKVVTKKDVSSSTSYAAMAAKPLPEVVEVADDLSGFVSLKMVEDSGVKLFNKNISHNWADDDYWSDEDC